MAAFVWTGVTSTAWSTGSNWDVGGISQSSPPAASDDVAIGSGTGATNNNCNVDVNSFCRSLDLSGYSGAFSGTTLTTLSIGDGTAGIGSRALRWPSSGFTYTSNGLIISFKSTNATQQTVDFASNNLSNTNVTFNGASGSWILSSGFTTTTTLTLTTGSLVTNGQTINCGTLLSNNSNTRTLDITNSAINLSATGTPWNVASSGITFTGTGSVINFTDTSASAKNFAGAGLTYNNLNWTAGGSGALVIAGSNTFNDWIGAGAKTINITAGSNQTFTTSGNLTMTGSNANLLTLQSSSSGTMYTLTKKTGTVSFDYMLISDCQTSGDVPWFAGANSTVNSTAPNTFPNNSGITFSTPSPIWQRQMATGVGTTSASAVLPLTPVQNNLLLAFPTTDVASGSLSMTTAGYNKDVPSTWSASAKSLGLYSKLAGSGESTTVTTAGASATNTTIIASEWVGITTSNYLDKTNHTDNQAASLTMQPGTTGALTLASELLIFCSATNSTATLPNSADTNFVVTARVVQTQTAIMSVAVFTTPHAVGVNPTLTITTNARANGDLIATYKATTYGGNLLMMGVG